MKILQILLLTVFFTGTAKTHADDYIFQGCVIQFSGDEPKGKTIEYLLESDSFAGVKTGKIQVSDGKPSIFSDTVTRKFPLYLPEEGKVFKEEEARIGMEGEVRIISRQKDLVRVWLRFADIRFGGPLISLGAGNQLVQPTFTRLGPEDTTIELNLGKWFILIPPKTEGPRYLHAYRLDRKKS